MNFANRIEILTLRSQRLQHIFNSDLVGLQKSFIDLKNCVDERAYKYEIMIAFWLAIDLCKHEEAAAMCDIDPVVV